jgi:predicted  nucleic acid-binding Zn-ribbon protein
MPHQCTDCGRRFDDGSKEMLSGCPNCGGNKFQFLPDGAATDAADVAEVPSEEPSSPEPPGSSVARTVGSAATAVRDLVGSSDSPPERELPSETVAASMEETPGGAESTRSTDRVRTETPEPAQRSEPTQQQEHRPDSSSASSAEPDHSQRPSSVERPQAGTDAAEPTVARMADTENAAQASARSEVISPDELPSTTNRPTRSRAAEEWSQSVPDSQEEESEPPEETDRPDLSELREELNQQFESIKVCEPGQYELNLMELFDREEYIIALQEDGKYTVQVPEHWQE